MNPGGVHRQCEWTPPIQWNKEARIRKCWNTSIAFVTWICNGGLTSVSAASCLPYMLLKFLQRPYTHTIYSIKLRRQTNSLILWFSSLFLISFGFRQTIYPSDVSTRLFLVRVTSLVESVSATFEYPGWFSSPLQDHTETVNHTHALLMGNLESTNEPFGLREEPKVPGENSHIPGEYT